jgi:phospholipase C
MAELSEARARLIDTAVATEGSSSLDDIEHVIILMQENRSFDHYFGTMSGVRGFGSAPAAVLRQAGAGPGGLLVPFRLYSDPPDRDGQCLNDITHDWVPQHQSWNGGAMDRFVATHVAADGAEDGPTAMGYYARADLPFFYALADAFTVCDGYFSSVIGPTDPNRIMAMSATIDPDGAAGGPVLETFGNRVAHYGTLRWETMPERLHEAGVSWKVYSARLAELALSPLPYFKAFADAFSVRGVELAARGLAPGFPDDFMEDVRKGSLPSVSWIIPPLAQCEHPAAPPAWGEHLVHEVLSALVANPEVWERSVLLVVHDENGGFFDHMPPVTAAEGTPGEWLTVSPLPAAAGQVRGPIGLGFRVACLVVSPFSRGGYVCSSTLDHTSLLRLIETRFGVEVPNLSAWRRSVTGDFTSALQVRSPDVTVPALPDTSVGEDVSVAEQAVLNALAGTFKRGVPYPLPTVNEPPVQEPGPPRPQVP